MTVRRPPRLGLLLTRLLPPEDAPLVGDLIEAQDDQTQGWFYRQVLFAVLVRTIGRARTAFHHEAIASALVPLAMFVVLGFQVAVASSLLAYLADALGFGALPWAPVRPQWLPGMTTLSFLTAVVVGHVARRIHHHSRLLVVLTCSVSASTMARLTLHVLAPASTRPVLPSVLLQVATAMVFITGLFVGFGSTSRMRTAD